MGKLEYEPNSVLDGLAIEVLELLRPKGLPIWQIKEVLNKASERIEWETLK